ncbi:26867_t:CDS:1, partial [Dentiscutata erythropus]
HSIKEKPPYNFVTTGSTGLWNFFNPFISSFEMRVADNDINGIPENRNLFAK